MGPANNRTTLGQTIAMQDLELTISANLNTAQQCQKVAQMASRALYQIKMVISSKKPEILVPFYMLSSYLIYSTAYKRGDRVH